MSSFKPDPKIPWTSCCCTSLLKREIERDFAEEKNPPDPL